METQTKSKKIRATIYKMIAIIVTTYLITYAWFAEFDKFDVKPLELGVTTVNDIEISIDDGATWENIVALEIGNDFVFSKPITSDGVEFYYTDVKEEDGTPISFATAVANKDYLEYRVLFRAQAPVAILLDEESLVVPAVGTEANDLLGASVVRESAYGNFSKDLIAGAVRVAVVETDIDGETYTPQTTAKLVWAPNKEYELSYANEAYSAIINSTASQNYNYIHVSAPTSFAEARVNNLKDNLNASNIERTAGGDPHLLYLDDLDIKAITVRVWVEGNDREALTALKGGLFKISLSFVGIVRQFDNVAPSVTADQGQHTITGFDSTMEYSIDYANNWITYANDPTPTIADNATVYVRKSETLTYYASTYTTLNF